MLALKQTMISLNCCSFEILSLPTTAINPGFVKKLAEIAANVAAPPKTFFKVFFGVLIVSRAVEPKTVSMSID